MCDRALDQVLPPEASVLFSEKYYLSKYPDVWDHLIRAEAPDALHSLFARADHAYQDKSIMATYAALSL